MTCVTSAPRPCWVPERDLRVLPDVEDRDVIELGCGAAYVSAWLTRRGARVVGIDNSPRQLETARELQPPEGATTRYPYVTADWARLWPSEEIWVARRR